jgi:hypothetical protein
MKRLVSLQIADTAALLAAGAAADLVQQLERAFAGAGITICKAQIGVDDAYEI